jgi:hypothetical protein
MTATRATPRLQTAERSAGNLLRSTLLDQPHRQQARARQAARMLGHESPPSFAAARTADASASMTKLLLVLALILPIVLSGVMIVRCRRSCCYRSLRHPDGSARRRG